MRDKEEFYGALEEIDGRPYDQYQKILGDFDFSRYVLKIGQVQSSSDGEPTMLLVRVPQSVAGFPSRLFSSPVRKAALEDLLTRQVAMAIEEQCDSGLVSISEPTPQILPRTSLQVLQEYVEARMYIDLPGKGGRVNGEAAAAVFSEELPLIVSSALIYAYLEPEEVDEAIGVMEDADAIRQQLRKRGLMAFVADGSILPRDPADGESPLLGAVPFVSPPELLVEMQLPSGRTIRGMGIPSGVTVVVGSLNQGKSSLISALAEGVYNHIPGDGREYVITQPDAVQILAEPGRSVHRVDVSGFFPTLPNGQDPRQFSTSSADGPTSQAASVMEMLEVGAGALLFDEDSSAPEFFGSNAVIDELAGETADAVRPLAQHLRGLWEQQQVASVVATRSVGEYIAHADLVLVMRKFQPAVVTEVAKAQIPAAPVAETGLVARPRSIVASTLDPSRGKTDQFIAVMPSLLVFGRDVADLRALTQLVDSAQIEAIGLILYYARLRFMDSENTVASTLDFIDRDLGRDGLGCLSRDLRGDLARPRRFEVAGVINRLPALRVHSDS